MHSPVDIDQASPSNRLSVWISALLVIFTLGAASFAVCSLRLDRLDDAQRDLDRLSTALAEQTARSVQAVDIVLRQLTERIIAEHTEPAEQLSLRLKDERTHALLTQMRGDLPQADAIIIIGNDGMMANTTRQWPIPVLDLSEREQFQHLRDHADRRLRKPTGAKQR